MNHKQAVAAAAALLLELAQLNVRVERLNDRLDDALILATPHATTETTDA